ncbi:twin-arginine translocation signal domain-containing protein [Tamlana sp. 2201CG12-4]|uniref:twin-arginine translocation signal domain-containing protein n=1 Tax=Tamlana sp. 2201CG12-4 TaxID=3112582 RepID=UPI002DBD32CF|nr:twin-arginine translocation signal domain-containing protein [Tamlana sp. 2201CG12-4]MEC3908874.1 twin-arginine translocation signal domain-containing protein [Tamlana sp. 2201CG12-4]
MNSRRNFVKNATLATAGISLVPNLSFGVLPSKNIQRLKRSFIGVGLSGTSHLNNALQKNDIEINIY